MTDYIITDLMQCRHDDITARNTHVYVCTLGHTVVKFVWFPRLSIQNSL